MGLIGIVDSVERRVDENGAYVVDVICDVGGDSVTAEHFVSPGEDSLPVKGDIIALEDSTGTGRAQVSGYFDERNEGKAESGEKRFVARDSNRVEVAELWIKGNGDVVITSIRAGGKIVLNGVEIDQNGNIKAPGKVEASELEAAGEVTANALAVPLALSQHIHSVQSFGPSGPPIAPPGV